MSQSAIETGSNSFASSSSSLNSSVSSFTFSLDSAASEKLFKPPSAPQSSFGFQSVLTANLKKRLITQNHASNNHAVGNSQVNSTKSSTPNPKRVRSEVSEALASLGESLAQGIAFISDSSVA